MQQGQFWVISSGFQYLGKHEEPSFGSFLVGSRIF